MESPDRSTTVSAKVSGERLDRLETFCDEHDVPKSQVLRDGIDAVTNTVSSEFETPLQPPQDDRLAWGYRRLVDVANDEGVVRDETAKRACSGGKHGLSKDEVISYIIKPLYRRNYIRKMSDLYGNRSWNIRGWDR
jgi:hypothetical protein